MMSTAMLNGFGFSRFMVLHSSNLAAKSTTEPTASSDETENSVLAKSALSPDALTHRSTAEGDTEHEEVAHDEREPLPHHVQLSYERVARVALESSSRIDWRQLRNSTSLWDEKKKLSASPNFTVYTRQSRGMHYVMAIGTLSCSVAELQSILRPTTDTAYRTAMTQLYSDAFVDGAIRYHSTTGSRAASGQTPSGRTPNSRRARPGRTASTATPAEAARLSFRSAPRMNATTTLAHSIRGSSSPDFMAKTATFARTHVFAKAHRWTFLECFQPTHDGFTIIMSSLSPDFEALPAATKRERSSTTADTTARVAVAASGSVEHIQGITAAYSVAAVPSRDDHQSGGSVLQVTFYSKFADDSTSFGPLKRHAFKLTLRAHLLQMARATTRLPVVVRRKRLEALAFVAGMSRVSPLANPLCICCTATLHFLRAKTRCYACSYFVCDKCSIEHEVELERPHAPLRLARVCQLCIRRVAQAAVDERNSYSHYRSRRGGLDESTARVSVRLPTLATESLLSAATTPTRPTKSSSIIDMLNRIVQSGPETKRTAATSVSKYMVDDACEQQQQQQQLRAVRLRSSSLSSLSSSLSSSMSSSASSVGVESFAHTDPAASDRDYLRVLQNHSCASRTAKNDRADVWVYYEDDSEFTTSTTSSIVSYESYNDADVVDDEVADFTEHFVSATPRPYPVPRNEAHRSRMAQQQLAQLADVSSLEIICSIASKELDCPVAMVTLVEGNKTHVVAANCEQYRGAVVPRSESLCAHTVMCDDDDDRGVAAQQPFVVQQPALDPRFRDLAIVRQRGLQFYCGFPLTSEDGSIVGALCCGDFGSPNAAASPAATAVHSEVDAEPSTGITPQQNDTMVKLAATASRVMQLRGKDVYKRL